MAVVRCPIHNIPYNDRNPRGCPACAAEREGTSPEAAAIRELARASRAVPAIEEPAPPPTAPRESWPPPVTTPPRLPVPEPRWYELLWSWAMRHRATAAGSVLVVIAAVLGWLITRPEFVPGLNPPLPVGDALPVPVEIHAPIEGVFARLGAVAPTVNPDDGQLARYDYGNGLAIDALNNVVYAVTLSTPARTWKGNRVGTSEELARSTIALLGNPLVRTPAPPRAPARVRGYQIYTAAADVPRRIVAAEVRPPNGCYDLLLDVAPRIIGRLRQGDGDVVAVATRTGQPDWTVVQIRIVSRALPGPYGGPIACDPILPLG